MALLPSWQGLAQGLSVVILASGVHMFDEAMLQSHQDAMLQQALSSTTRAFKWQSADKDARSGAAGGAVG